MHDRIYSDTGHLLRLPPLIFITRSAFLPEYSRFLMEVGPALLVKAVSPAKLWDSVERLLGPRRT